MRHIEVKGRVAGATTVTLTHNETLYALNQSEKFWLAMVFVHENGNVDAPAYKQAPFSDPDSGNFKISRLFRE